MEALLNALACERGRYNQASEALHNAHETILTLEAQVARREAELESRDHRRVADTNPIPRKRSLVEALRPNLPEVPLSEVVQSLSIAEERNHDLEQEVHELHNRVSRPPSPGSIL
jgi:predicted  nucleic acid-binding Zn-ribbon protein